MFEKIINFPGNEKNFYKIYFILVLFLCIVKLPSLFTDDLQPWDEGMYATRVLSIHEYNDFFNQSQHSIGGFYSASHPPLLIWTGYFLTLITGVNSVTLKLIPFVLSLLCIYLLIKLGEKISGQSAGFIAALIFSGNIIFSVFSKRFQFDIPYTFFILLSFYLFFLFIEKNKRTYLIAGGIVFGLCLMVKILVGFLIPIIIFIAYIILRKKINIKFSYLIYFTSIGILIALPWHLYMILIYGKDFMNYFLYYHIFERAFIGVEHNTKGSGFLYHINYFLSILPFSIIAFWATIKYIINYKNLSWQKVFLTIWFLSGLIIISVFKTKLEIYVLLILTPGSLIIGDYLVNIKNTLTKERVLLLILTFLNIAWYISFYIRNDIKLRQEWSDKYPIFILSVLLSTILVFFISIYIARRFEIGKFYYVFIVLFFISLNVYYCFNTPIWENEYKLTPIKKLIESSKRENIIYIGTNYRANPQFTFYFKGLDLGWKYDKYNFEIFDTKIGNNQILDTLKKMNEGKYNIIVERDNINRTIYEDSKNFIPSNFKLSRKTSGYELYQN
jgi:4-amino-4-deoxy-L-arabinose transferase-like glycosyltransferase